ncbi:Hypothetical predicted protein [Olea europaea subsp. europaea]|uniref:Uncharacterized protein n=1 Tax=Olea europaea subsp. europaea TaxID=158383 RepID=A0A8S0R808_OLEEU|nr:Hypothetical predicted protein [Olea europaea subsp. europaea]
MGFRNGHTSIVIDCSFEPELRSPESINHVIVEFHVGTEKRGFIYNHEWRIPEVVEEDERHESSSIICLDPSEPYEELQKFLMAEIESYHIRPRELEERFTHLLIILARINAETRRKMTLSVSIMKVLNYNFDESSLLL